MKLLPVISIMILGYLIQSTPIIIRHDVPEEKYIAFANTLPETAAIVKYSSTDLAGTLIDPQWVLSAAHVAETIPQGHRLIVAGDSVGIDRIIIHPGWQENGRPDLALIKLARTIENVTPVKLYTMKDEVDKQVIVAGTGDYGNGLNGIEGDPGTMRAGTNLVDGTTGDSHFLYWQFDAPENDRVTSLEAISGPGDSSGPAFIEAGGETYVAGISAAQSTQATGGVEGVYGVTEYYTRVSTFAEWILERIRE